MLRSCAGVFERRKALCYCLFTAFAPLSSPPVVTVSPRPPLDIPSLVTVVTVSPRPSLDIPSLVTVVTVSPRPSLDIPSLVTVVTVSRVLHLSLIHI